MVQEEINFRGHPNIRSLHERTVEITKNENLTIRGDCIIGVKANKSCADLNERLKRNLQSADAIAKIEIAVGSESLTLRGEGDSRLTLSDEHDIVIRKTRFICPRTLSIKCDIASSDVPRDMIGLLQDPGAKGIFRITVE